MKIPRAISEIFTQFQDIRHNLLTMYKFLIFIIPFLTIAYYFIFVFDIQGVIPMKTIGFGDPDFHGPDTCL